MKAALVRFEALDKITDLLNRYPFLNTVVLSLTILLFYYLVRFLFNTNIDKKRDLSAAEKVIYKKKLGQYLFYILLICFLLLWVSQLQVFFVSLMAVAAAIVIAFKELIMCITGGSLVRIGKVFHTGDRIEVSGTRGFVIEKKLLTTKILEIGPEKNSQQTTGDIIVIPNSLMLSTTVKNESYFKGYSIKSFSFKIPSAKNFDAYNEGILSCAQKISENYIDQAKAEINLFCSKEGISIPAINPRTKILIDDKGGLSLLVKLPVKNSEVGEIEQILNRNYLDLRLKMLEAKDASKEYESQD